MYGMLVAKTKFGLYGDTITQVGDTSIAIPFLFDSFHFDTFANGKTHFACNSSIVQEHRV